MRFIPFILLALITACGSSSNGFNTAYFKLVKATSQEWIAGAKGSGRGTTYRFEIIAKSSEKVEYRTAWIGKESFGLQAKVPLEKMDLPIKKGDVIILECTKRINPDREEPQATKKPVPFEYEGAALIEYLVGGEKNYFVVSSLEKLPRTEYM